MERIRQPSFDQEVAMTMWLITNYEIHHQCRVLIANQMKKEAIEAHRLENLNQVAGTNRLIFPLFPWKGKIH